MNIWQLPCLIFLFIVPMRALAQMKWCPIPKFPDAHYDNDETKLKPRDEVKLRCNNGYRDRPTSTTCGDDYTWSTPDPPCQKIRCPMMENPEHGRVEHSGDTVNSTATITCLPRYIYSEHHTTRICKPNGNWSGREGRCQDIECPHITQLDFGAVNATGYKIDDTLTFTCSRAYKYNGTKRRVCKDDAQWSGVAGICQEVKCPHLTVQYGSVTYTDNRYGGKAEIRCTEGFAYTRYCTLDGRWSGEEGLCEERMCPIKEPEKVEYGHISAASDSLLPSWILQCEPGYIIDGPRETFCGKHGSWAPKLGQCRPQHIGRGAALTVVVTILGVLVTLLVVLLCIIWKQYHQKPRTGISDVELQTSKFHLNGNPDHATYVGFLK